MAGSKEKKKKGSKEKGSSEKSGEVDGEDTSTPEFKAGMDALRTRMLEYLAAHPAVGADRASVLSMDVGPPPPPGGGGEGGGAPKTSSKEKDHGSKASAERGSKSSVNSDLGEHMAQWLLNEDRLRRFFIGYDLLVDKAFDGLKKCADLRTKYDLWGLTKRPVEGELKQVGFVRFEPLELVHLWDSNRWYFRYSFVGFEPLELVGLCESPFVFSCEPD